MRGSPESVCEERCEPATGPVGCRQQTECAFATELARLQTQKVRFLRSRGLDEQSAEEVVSRAVIKLLQVRIPIRHLPAYFHQIVVRERINLAREMEQQRRFAHLFHQDEEDHHRPLDWFEYQERMAVLRSLKGISPRGLALAELRWVFGWSTDDLIDATGLSRAAIDQQISRVRKAARRASDEGLI